MQQWRDVGTDAGGPAGLISESTGQEAESRAQAHGRQEARQDGIETGRRPLLVGALRVDRIHSLEGLLALEREWSGLEKASATGLPFMTWAWAVAWWTNLSKSRLHVRDLLFVRAVRSPTGELVAVAPLMLTERPALGLIRTRQIQFFGRDDAGITELRGLLCVPGLELPVCNALLDDLRACPESWDWSLWSTVIAGGVGERVFRSRGGEPADGEVPNYVLDLAPTWEEFKSKLSRNIKESLRRCYNSLRRVNLTFSMDVVCERSRVAGSLATFFGLHAARARATGMKPHQDVFATPRRRRFLIEVCERLAEGGHTRIFALKIGGEPVAMRIGFAHADSLYLYYSGYDPAFAKYSVMTTTVAEAIKYAISEGFRTVNMSNGNDVSKTRWGAREVIYRDIVQFSPSRRSKVAHVAYRQFHRFLRFSPDD